MSETKGTERPTKIIKTPNEHEVVVYTYLTGREKRETQRPFYKLAKVSETDITNTKNPDDLKLSMDEIPPEVIEDAQDALIKALVVSVDGSDKNVLESVLELRDEDFEFVWDEVRSIRDGLSEDVKKK